MAHEAGKGSKSRPFSVTQQEYDSRWGAIFGRDIRKEEDALAEDEAFNAIIERENRHRRNNSETQPVKENKF